VATARRSIVLWIAAAAMAALGAWHVLHGVTAFLQWQRWRTSDPSLADFFWTELEIETVFTLGCLFVALVLAAAARWLPEIRRSDEHA
jgi:accessory colonization factor AcfC